MATYSVSIAETGAASTAFSSALIGGGPSYPSFLPLLSPPLSGGYVLVPDNSTNLFTPVSVAANGSFVTNAGGGEYFNVRVFDDVLGNWHAQSPIVVHVSGTIDVASDYPSFFSYLSPAGADGDVIHADELTNQRKIIDFNDDGSFRTAAGSTEYVEVRFFDDSTGYMHVQSPMLVRVSGGIFFDLTLSETGAAVFALSATLVRATMLAESATASDALNATRLTVAVIVNAATALDALLAQLVGTATLTNLAAASDSFSSAQVYVVSVTELLAAFNNYSTDNAYLAGLAEIGNSQDVLTALTIGTALLSESASAADALETGRLVVAALSESASASELLSAMHQAIGHLAESSPASDSLTANPISVISLSESGAAADELSLPRNFFSAMSESGAASDSLYVIVPVQYSTKRVLLVKHQGRVLIVRSNARVILH